MVKDIVGKKFGKLLATEILGKDKHGKYLIHCNCDCGKDIILAKTLLLTGKRTSCGCIFRENSSAHCKKAFTSHGESKTRFFGIWHGMKRRCKTSYFKKGTVVCKRWNDYMNFREDMYDNYLKHVASYGAKNTTIDRIDNNGNYELGNCRWSTMEEQNNNKSNLILIEYKGKTNSAKKWSRIFGVRYSLFLSRIKRGWSIEEAYKIPSRQKKFD